jgi:hypothetical protein
MGRREMKEKRREGEGKYYQAANSARRIESERTPKGVSVNGIVGNMF